jgi:hypothetical protein
MISEMKDSGAKAHTGDCQSPSNVGKRSSSPRAGAASSARLEPETDLGQAATDGAVDNLAKFRDRAKKAPLAEALGARHQGHKY